MKVEAFYVKTKFLFEFGGQTMEIYAGDYPSACVRFVEILTTMKLLHVERGDLAKGPAIYVPN